MPPFFLSAPDRRQWEQPTNVSEECLVHPRQVLVLVNQNLHHICKGPCIIITCSESFIMDHSPLCLVYLTRKQHILLCKSRLQLQSPNPGFKQNPHKLLICFPETNKINLTFEKWFQIFFFIFGVTELDFIPLKMCTLEYQDTCICSRCQTGMRWYQSWNRILAGYFQAMLRACYVILNSFVKHNTKLIVLLIQPSVPPSLLSETPNLYALSENMVLHF